MQTNEELALAIKAGNAELMEQLWEQCYGFIRLLATRYLHEWDGKASFDLDDLTQQGYFGLCEACKTFQPEKASFCHWLSLHLKTAFADVAGCRTMAQKLDPLNTAYSLDEPMKTGDDAGEAVIGELVADPRRDDLAADDEVFRQQCAAVLRCKIAQLQENQRAAVEMKYWQNATDQAIADALQCSRTYANVSVKAGIKTLRKRDTDHTLRNLLDDMYYRERDLYTGTGYGFFKSTGYSKLEYEVMHKEGKERQKRQQREKMQREKDIALLMDLGLDRQTAEQICA